MYQLTLEDYANETREVPLTQGQIAIVSACDYDWLTQWRWYCLAGRYACRNTTKDGRRICIYMHRLITSAPEDMQVDHINRNKLDNRRCNLRLATHTENGRNSAKCKTSAQKTSQYKGVFWSREYRVWLAKICPNRKQTHLGTFTSEIEAAVAYDNAARLHFGEFACLNFPNGATP